MPGLPQQRELEALIEQAMRDRAPAMHRSLTADGTLSAVLKDRAEMARESYEEAMNAALTLATKASRTLTGPERVNELTQARSQAASTAINQAVEFEASPPESEEPTILQRKVA